MEISFTEEEFSNYKVVRGIILSNDYVDYDYYAVYIPKEDKVELYFKNPFDGKYYNVKDIKTILGKKLNPCNDIYIDLVRDEFNDYKTFIRWATFKQAEMAGGRVKKGAKGTHIEYWQYTQDVMELNPKTGKKEPVYEVNPDTGERKKKQVVLEHPIVKSYVVFNGDQIEGIEKEQLPVIKQEDKNRNMENMIKNSEAKIFFDELSRNYYSSSKDEIHVIPREKFKTLDNFYATVAHEIAHSTGAEGRLNRETLKNNDGFGNEIYAKEELRAELTSMFLQQRYNVNFDEKHYENHAAYLQSWAQVIKNDPNEIYRAAADAEKAMSYIETRMINKNLTKDKEKSVQKEITLENKTPKRIIKQKITMKIDTQKSKSKERTLTR